MIWNEEKKGESRSRDSNLRPSPESRHPPAVRGDGCVSLSWDCSRWPVSDPTYMKFGSRVLGNWLSPPWQAPALPGLWVCKRKELIPAAPRSRSLGRPGHTTGLGSDPAGHSRGIQEEWWAESLRQGSCTQPEGARSDRR